MAKKEVVKKIEGYDQIISESIVLEKYGFDYQARKGEIQKIIDALHPRNLDLVVSRIDNATRTSKIFRLVPVDGQLPPIMAGQYINIFFDVGGIRTSRPYSIASSPSQSAYYEIAVRRVEDGFVSNYLLDEVKPGDRLQTSSPSGNFHYNPLFHGDRLAYMAGGSGITPFMSMIREVSDRNLNRRIHLFYGSRDEDDVIYRDELNDIAAANANFTWDMVVSEPGASYKGIRGLITAELVNGKLGDNDWMFFLCGPQAMYDFCMPELAKIRIPERRIKKEVMGSPKNITMHPGWPAEIKPDDVFKVNIKGKTSIDARASETLMISLERAGIVIPALCRSGECSICRTKLLSGKVYQPNGVKLRKSDRDFGYIHPCLAYPVTDIEIMI